MTAYDIRLDGRPLMTLPAALLTGGVTVPISGLTPDTAYTFAVTARDASGNTSAEAGPLTVTTGTPSGEPISEGQATVDAQAVTYRARYNLPFDFHHVFLDIDSDAATGFATAGVRRRLPDRERLVLPAHRDRVELGAGRRAEPAGLLRRRSLRLADPAERAGRRRDRATGGLPRRRQLAQAYSPIINVQ